MSPGPTRRSSRRPRRARRTTARSLARSQGTSSCRYGQRSRPEPRKRQRLHEEGGRDRGDERGDDADTIDRRADREEERREREEAVAEPAHHVYRRGPAALRVREHRKHARVHRIGGEKTGQLRSEERGGAGDDQHEHGRDRHACRKIPARWGDRGGKIARLRQDADRQRERDERSEVEREQRERQLAAEWKRAQRDQDRKSTRLNSSH